MKYAYCSMCAHKLIKRPDGHLACSACPFVNYHNPRPTVTGLIMYHNKLLFTRRARDPFKGWWDLPGGFMEKGETPEHAIKRELKEETGLTIRIRKLFGIYPGIYPSSFEPFHVLSIVYLATCSSVSLEAHDDVIESKWFSPKEIPRRIAFDSGRDIIRDFLRTTQ